MGALPIITLFAALGNFALGFWVLLHKSKSSSTKRAFILFSIITGFWSFSNFFLAVTPSFLILSISYAFGTLVAASAVLWVLLFSRKKVTPVILFIIGISAVIFIAISFIPKGLVTEMVVENGYVFFRKDNFFFPLWSLYIVFTVFTVWWSLWSSMRTATGIFREQIKFILLGAFGFGGGALLTDVVFPYVGLNYLTILDGTVSLLFTFPAAYAMVRYRFMDVRIVLRKGTVYAITIVIALGIYSYLAFIGAQTAEQLFGYQNTFSNFIAVILIAIGFHPLRRMVEYALNAYFFPKQADFRAVAKRIAIQLSSTISGIESILKTIRKEAGPTLGVESIDLFFQKEYGIWEAVQPAANPAININPQTPLFKYIVKNKNILITEEIAFQINDSNNSEEIKTLESVNLLISERNIAVVVPIFQEYEDLIGILFLGSKMNQSAYTIEDIQFLNNLQQNLPLSMSGIILYYQAMKRVQEKIKK